MYTTHGHHIPGTPEAGKQRRPIPVGCGGPSGLCPRCLAEVTAYLDEREAEVPNHTTSVDSVDATSRIRSSAKPDQPYRG